MRSLCILVALLGCALLGEATTWGTQLCQQNAEEYRNHVVFRLHVNDTTTLRKLQAMLDEPSAPSKYDAWTSYARFGFNDIRVVPSAIQEFTQRLDTMGISYSVSIPDVAALLEREQLEQSTPSQDDFFDQYRSYDDHIAFLKLQATQYPKLATVVTIGKTLQGRDIQGLKIAGSATKQKIFYNGGQHAREWISPATVAWITNQLLVNYGTNAQITTLVDYFEWTLVPIVNADGYEYTKTNRMWRKNRRANSGTTCIGVDNNRNWAYRWNNGGSSKDPCNDAYMGPSASSEPENTAVASYISSHGPFVGYIDFHAYGQLFMNPWGWTSDLPKDNAAQIACGKSVAAAILGVGKKTYTVGNIYTVIYQASGSSADWTYGTAGVKYSYACELRDTGQYGFLLPTNQIIPQGQEMFAGVVAMGNYIMTQGA